MASKIVIASALANETKNESNLIKEIDDDDDFEEFETAETENIDTKETAEVKESINVWEDNWDDESAETDFSKQLK